MFKAVLCVLAFGLAGAASAEPARSCASVARDSVRARFTPMTANYTTDGFAMRRQSGVSVCRFTAAGEGGCEVTAPGLVHVTTANTNAFFRVPRGRTARISVNGGTARCAVAG